MRFENIFIITQVADTLVRSAVILIFFAKIAKAVSASFFRKKVADTAFYIFKIF